MTPKPQTLSTEPFRAYALQTIAAGVVLAMLYFGRAFFVTAIIAIIIAFILESFVTLLMRFRFPRSMAVFVVCGVALLTLYFVGLGAYNQVSRLVKELPKLSQRMGDLLESTRKRIDEVEKDIYTIVARKRAQTPLAPTTPPALRGKRNPITIATTAIPGAIPEVRIHEEERNPITDYLYARLSALYEFLLMASFVPVLVYFMLSWRDHMYRSFLHFFHGENRAIAQRSLEGIADMARAFVVGNFVMGLLLAAISAVAFWLIGLPFPFLAGPLSGLLSLVPYVGLPLALIPPLFVTLAAAGNVSALALVLAVVTILHLIAMNVLYPTLVGSRVHLNPLVVTFSLMFWGFLWDAPGLILAIPITAGIKAVCDNVQPLRPFGRFLSD